MIGARAFIYSMTSIAPSANNTLRLIMNEKEARLQMITIGRNSLITAILALKIDYYVDDLEHLRDLVNRHIKELKEDLKA